MSGHPVISWRIWGETIANINDAVDRSGAWKSDLEQFGYTDDWRIPHVDRSGKFIDDCDGYVMLKFHRLAQCGVPTYWMLPTYCIAEEGSGHLVLAIKIGGPVIGESYIFLDQRFPSQVLTINSPELRDYQWISCRTPGDSIIAPWKKLRVEEDG